MAHGVPYPGVIAFSGENKGPIVDLRLEEIRKAQRLAEARDKDFQRALEALSNRIEVLHAVRHVELKSEAGHLGDSLTLFEERLLKVLEAYDSNMKRILSADVIDLKQAQQVEMEEFKAKLWPILLKSAWNWLKRPLKWR